MSRRSITTATFRVKLRLPPGAKVPDAQTFIWDALEAKQSLEASIAPNAPMSSLAVNEVIITLEKRETAYL